MRRLNKRAVGLSDAPMLIITLVIIGIVAALGLTVLGDVQDTQGDAAAIVNESLGAPTVTVPVKLLNEDIIATDVWVNKSGTIVELVLGRNYTEALLSGYITINDTGMSGLNNATYINYSYTTHPAEFNATSNAILGISAFTDLMPVIGLVVAIVIVLGVLFLLFRPGSRGGI